VSGILILVIDDLVGCAQYHANRPARQSLVAPKKRVSRCSRTGMPEQVYGNPVFPRSKRSSILIPVDWYGGMRKRRIVFSRSNHFTSRRKERVISGRDASGSWRAAMKMALASRS
jgi:hypothetical protein